MWLVLASKKVGRVVGLFWVVQWGEKLVMWLVLAFLLVVKFEVLMGIVFLLVTDRKMIARKQVLVVSLGLKLRY